MPEDSTRCPTCPPELAMIMDSLPGEWWLWCSHCGTLKKSRVAEINSDPCTQVPLILYEKDFAKAKDTGV